MILYDVIIETSRLGKIKLSYKYHLINDLNS